MKRASTKISAGKRLKISGETRLAYGKRDRRLDSDPDAPQLPPDYWSSAVIGKYYRPLKTQISFRIGHRYHPLPLRLTYARSFAATPGALRVANRCRRGG